MQMASDISIVAQMFECVNFGVRFCHVYLTGGENEKSEFFLVNYVTEVVRTFNHEEMAPAPKKTRRSLVARICAAGWGVV